MTETLKAENRKGFLDILRVSATIAVVLLHTVTGIMDATDMNLYPLEKKVFLITLDFITWCVPVFVLISGYLFLNPEREISFGQMLKKYCRRIALALFLFGTPYACLELIMGEQRFRLGMIPESALMVLQGRSWSHMWYLYLILFLYLLTPGLKALLKKLPTGMLYGILALLFLGSSLLPYIKKLFDLQDMIVLPDGGIYLFYYLCGYLFAKERERGIGAVQNEAAPDVRHHSPTLYYTALGLVFLLGAGMAASRILGSYSVQMAYNYPFTVVLSLLLVWLLRHREEKLRKENRAFWKKGGALCFAVYLVHPVFVNVYYKFLHITPLNFPAEACYLWESVPRIALSLPLFFLMTMAPAVLSAWILCKVPVLRKYVL